MPRVRANGALPTSAPAHSKSPVKIPLNDDRQEKAKRLQSRQAFHEMQMNSLKVAASPARKRKSMGGEQAPHTPRDNVDSQEDGGFHVGGSAVTPMKRVPLLANFEEWMKMATDNKINATNSWNFALIDYFHDMSLLREGDSVNFQKASCTLDGCVKIYTSRVDSVATETGKLLSGLADSGNKKQRDDDKGDGVDDDADDDDGEDGVKRRAKKKTRSAEATLATSFAQLQLKKMELEFSVDPLFKKASADFDEGGAKGLLLNHLSIDNTGRIVFDSSDDAHDEAEEESRRDSMLEEGESATPKDEENKNHTPTEDARIDIAGLAAAFFPDLSKLDHQDVCPSLKTFELGDGTGSLDLPFLKAPDDWRKEKEDEDLDDARSGIVLDDDDAHGFDDDDAALGGFDLPPDTGFGQGGEAWAKEAHIEAQIRVHNTGPNDPDVAPGADDGEVGNFDGTSKQYGVTLSHRSGGDEHENILSYFDQALQKNWAGPEHWKIKKVKDAAKSALPSAPTKRKEKEPFEIDFASPMTQHLADLLYTPAASNAAISLPKAQWKSKTRNLLPDDKHFSSRDLLRLFLKPKARLGARVKSSSSSASRARPDPEIPDGDIDEAYWAQQQQAQTALAAEDADDAAAKADYDADFFQDDGFGAAAPGAADDDDGDDDEFADAQELLPSQSDGLDGALATLGAAEALLPPSQEGAFGTQLVTQSRRLRPEYVQYARVAKKVDVRRLKEEMWRGIGFSQSKPSHTQEQQQQSNPSAPLDAQFPNTDTADSSSEPLKFTTIINNLQSVYPKQQMADISTSYCFICLLHLANEKGLVISNEDGFQELSIRRDFSAEITGEES